MLTLCGSGRIAFASLEHGLEGGARGAGGGGVVGLGHLGADSSLAQDAQALDLGGGEAGQLSVSAFPLRLDRGESQGEVPCIPKLSVPAGCAGKGTPNSSGC